ncbi:hypothetical protein [Streptomyces sp. NPDC018693]|uniref:hypothetical protein n=1 Tax=unclassified Streptomyces TaxID=2593676 RepID=UPI0037AEEA8A
MTAHSTLLQLLGEWVTVTHPDAPHRVWHGKLRDVMHAPCIVLDLPEGGTQVFPQAFDIAAAAPAPGGPHPDVRAEARPFAALRDTGLLWLINRIAFHPRGLALALHLDEHGQAYGWSLVTNTDGEPWQFDPATDNDGYRRAENTIAAVLDRQDDAARCCVCGGRPVAYENYRDQPFCAGCANCDCGQNVCTRTRPDAAGPSTTSTDSVRTHPDPDAPDTSGRGVRIEYRARVPRHLAPAALAEAFQAIADARATQEDPAGPAPDGVPRCTATWDGPQQGGPARCWRAASHNDDERRALDIPLHTGRNSTGTRYRWSDSDDGAHPHLDTDRTPADAYPAIGLQTSGRTRPPVLGTGVTSTDTIRTPRPDTAPSRPDTREWKVCGDRRCIDPRCREEATLAEAREHIANAMELPLDLLAPVRCDCGQTGPLVGEAAGGHHFHISPEEHEQLMRGPDEGLPGSAWAKCWDRAEALRADLNTVVTAYEALRTRTITTSKYVKQQSNLGSPFRGGDTRNRILDTLAVWTEDPGPLKLATLTDSEAP